MKKEFLDYLYELRALVQLDIDRLAEIGKQPKSPEMIGSDENMTELRTRRSQIQSVNQTIEKYIDTHSKSI